MPSDAVVRAMARITSIKNQKRCGMFFFSYVPTRQVFLAGSRDGLTQEEFHEKVRNSQQRIADIFGRWNTPKGKGYMKIRKEAMRELAHVMPRLDDDEKG